MPEHVNESLETPTLISVLQMFFSYGMIAAGVKPEGEFEEEGVDLEMVGYNIGILEVLEAKTSGNRSAEESAALDEMLSALRFVYVELRKANEQI